MLAARKALYRITAVVAVLGLLTIPASAMSLGQAKSKGLVGEQADGYVGVVDSSSSEARAVADKVNGNRRKKYQQIAKKRGASVEEVAALAGAKLVQRAPKGEYVRGKSGGWKQK